MVNQPVPTRDKLQDGADRLVAFDAGNQMMVELDTNLADGDAASQDIVNDFLLTALNVDLQQVDMIVMILLHQR